MCDPADMQLRPGCPNCNEPLPARLALIGAGSTIRCDGCDCALEIPKSNLRLGIACLIVASLINKQLGGGFIVFVAIMLAVAIGTYVEYRTLKPKLVRQLPK